MVGRVGFVASRNLGTVAREMSLRPGSSSCGNLTPPNPADRITGSSESLMQIEILVLISYRNPRRKHHNSPFP